MKNVFVILAALVLTAASCQKTTVTNGVPNLHMVDAGVYRGGQPTDAGWVYLKSLGVSNVVKLNTEDEGSENGARAIGMTVYYYPITTIEQTFGPVASKLKSAVEHLTPGTFLHCEYGKNRTGTAIMTYRVQHDGWSKQKAEQEANNLGWGDSLPALKHFFYDEVK